MEIYEYICKGWKVWWQCSTWWMRWIYRGVCLFTVLSIFMPRLSFWSTEILKTSEIHSDLFTFLGHSIGIPTIESSQPLFHKHNHLMKRDTPHALWFLQLSVPLELSTYWRYMYKTLNGSISYSSLGLLFHFKSMMNEWITVTKAASHFRLHLLGEDIKPERENEWESPPRIHYDTIMCVQYIVWYLGL